MILRIRLSVDAENKYYNKKLTNEDIRKELTDNGFITIMGEDNEIIDFKFEGRSFKNCGIREQIDFEVYLEIEFYDI